MIYLVMNMLGCFNSRDNRMKFLKIFLWEMEALFDRVRVLFYLLELRLNCFEK